MMPTAHQEDLDEPHEPLSDVGSAGSVSRIKKARIATSGLLRHMWSQAMDFASPDWPPKWLPFAALIPFVVLGLIVVILFQAVLSLISSIWSALLNVRMAGEVSDTVRAYIGEHAGASPMSSPRDLEIVWWSAGIVLLLAAMQGYVGGRIGWALYGLLTAGLVWSQTAPPSKWLIAGLVTLVWSLLSIGAYGRDAKKSRSRSPGKKLNVSLDPFHATKRGASKRARKLGYDDVGAYLDQRGNQPYKVVTSELEVTTNDAKRILEDHFPEGIPRRIRLSPRQQRAAIEQWNNNKTTYAQIARDYGVSPKTVSSLIAKNKVES